MHLRGEMLQNGVQPQTLIHIKEPRDGPEKHNIGCPGVAHLVCDLSSLNQMEVLKLRLDDLGDVFRVVHLSQVDYRRIDLMIVHDYPACRPQMDDPPPPHPRHQDIGHVVSHGILSLYYWGQSRETRVQIRSHWVFDIWTFG